MNKLKFLFKIFIIFLKLGSVSFGGGYAAVSLMEREVVEEKKWINKEKIVDIFAVAQSLPGAVSLNSSVFVGYSLAGIKGAIAALIGNLTPAVFIMIILSVLLKEFSNNIYVISAFNGIRPVIVGLILYASYKIGKTSVKDIYCIIITSITFVFAIVFHISVITIILCSILSGLLLSMYKYYSLKRNEKNKEKEDTYDNID